MLLDRRIDYTAFYEFVISFGYDRVIGISDMDFCRLAVGEENR